MRRVAFLGAGALVGASAFGQNPLECVDPDVLRALVFPGNADQSVVVSSGLPDELAAIVAPSPFTLIGSMERDLGAVLNGVTIRTVSAVYRTTLSPDAARAAALDGLAAAGWEVQPAQGPQMGSGVFVSTNQMPVSQAACRDDMPINVTARTVDGKTYVTYGVSIGSNSSACDPRASAQFMSRSPLDEHMPKLELPSDPSTGEPARMRGSGGGGGSNSRNVRVEFRVAESVRNVASSFARQMADQGWTADATWSGSTTAGSSWTKESAMGTLLGSLRVTAVADGEFTVVLNVVPVS